MERLYFINIFKIYKDYYSYIAPVYNKNEKKISNITNKKYKVYIQTLLIIFCLFVTFSYYKKYNTKIFRKFIKDCNNFKIYNNIKIIKNQIPYLSICIPVYNMEKYIEKSILSIINQTFQDFEIVIVNDNSNDKTEIIIKRLQKEFKEIKVINHNKNLGVYFSRIDAALNSNGKYILFIDPDDMLLHQYLFEELFKYNLNYNLDMIEFSVYHKKEKEKKIYFPYFHEFNHYHNLNKTILYQPELSNILFYIPNTKNYSSLICRTIWNKLIRKTVIIKTIRYIEKFFHNIYLITADDTPLNILNFNFANNYSNIKLPGYLYNIRKNSMSRIDNGKKHDLLVSYNYLLYFKLFFKYLKDFKKDLNFLFYDLKVGYLYILKFKELNSTKLIKSSINFFNEIIKEDISLDFKNYSNEIIYKLKK